MGFIRRSVLPVLCRFVLFLQLEWGVLESRPMKQSSTAKVTAYLVGTQMTEVRSTGLVQVVDVPTDR